MPHRTAGVDSAYSWFRLAISVLLMVVAGSGMFVIVVVLPAVQAEFGATRGGVSFPYTLTMLGFGFGGIVLGRMADRHGVALPLAIGGVLTGLGFVAAGYADSLTTFALAQGLLIGVGSSATFGPLMTDVSFWFERRRGLAVAIVAAGNYLAGAVWPPIVQHFVERAGWRATYIGVGIACVALILPLALLMRRRAPGLAAVPGAVPSPATGSAAATAAAVAASSSVPTSTRVASAPAAASAPTAASASAAAPTVDLERPLGLSPATLQTLLCIAGVACCVAMSMPQVHIVAYCSDLGFGPARGAEMLSLMLACGVVSRLASGVIADRIGGLRTLMLGSVLQGIALLMFLPFDGLASLYLISAMFGLFQGGIVPSYALIVRQFFSPAQAGARVGAVLFATLIGMALGGWLSGQVFDLTGSYTGAFVHGVAWNLVNLSIVAWLLLRSKRLGIGPKGIAMAAA